MNATDHFPASTLALSREPFIASRKLHLPGQMPGVRVPMREIALTNGERVVVYDTSGPYSDPTAGVDVTRGLPDVRGAWVAARGDTETYAGRTRQALDDGVKNEARQNDTTIDRIEALRPTLTLLAGSAVVVVEVRRLAGLRALAETEYPQRRKGR